MSRSDRPRGGLRELPDGTLLPGVTSVLGVLAKPQLVPWAARLERELCVRVAGEVFADTATTAKIGFVEALKQRLPARYANAEVSDGAKNTGKAVHELIEWNMRRQVGLAVAIEPRLPSEAEFAFSAFERWTQSVHLVPRFVEFPVWNRRAGYAGTLDVFGVMGAQGQETVIIDWKTGNGMYDEYDLQSAAYAEALVEMGHAQHPITGLIVRFPRKQEKEPFEVRILDPKGHQQRYETFLAALKLWKWKEQCNADHR